MTRVLQMMKRFKRNTNLMPDPEGFTAGWAFGIHAIAAAATAEPGPYGIGTAKLLTTIGAATPSTTSSFHRTNPTLGFFAARQTLSCFVKQPTANPSGYFNLAFRGENTTQRYSAIFKWTNGDLRPFLMDDTPIRAKSYPVGNGWYRCLAEFVPGTGQGGGTQPPLLRPPTDITTAALVNTTAVGEPRRLFCWNADYDGVNALGTWAWGAMLEDDVGIHDAKPYFANADGVNGPNYGGEFNLIAPNVHGTPDNGRIEVTDHSGVGVFSIDIRGRMGTGMPWVLLDTIANTDLIAGTYFGDIAKMPQMQAWPTGTATFDATTELSVTLHE